MPVCQSCGTTNPARARFCMSCASPLAGDMPAPHGARKDVTIVFCDVAGSTPLGERLDPESVREVMSRFFRQMRIAVERHGGTVEKFIGDAVMAVFGAPLAHEDDALRAVRAAHAMQEELEGLNADLEARFDVRLRIRTGVNTGEVVVGDPGQGQALVVGDAVNVAARLEQSAAPGEILLGPGTYALVRDHVQAEEIEPLHLKGKRGTVAAHRLVSVAPQPDAVGARPAPTFVGRDRELTSLRTLFESTVIERRCGFATVLGAAGVGKSRLAREFAGSIGAEVLVLRARCLPYGEGITFWPVGELVKQACAIGDGESRDQARAKIEAFLDGCEDAQLVAARVAAVTGLSDASAGLQETFWAIRRFLEWAGRSRPLVVVLDDLQWAEPTFLDLVEYLAGRGRGVAMMLLCLARPELTEVRPTWGGGAAGSVVLALAPLGDKESEDLVADLLGGARLDQRVFARIAESAGGNPLFLEEMLRMLEDDGLLTQQAGAWVASADLGEVRVPGSIQALLGARLDRLSQEERSVIRAAAVVGKVFWRSAIDELVPDAVRPHVGGALQTLVRKDLIRSEPSPVPGEDAFRFHHILILEVAYRGTPKQDRARAHESFAAWVENTAGDRAIELEEVIGYHLEQAYRYRTELASAGERELELARRAAPRLAAAGSRAFERRDVTAAADLLGRAADLFADEAPERRPVLLALGEVLAEVGDLGRAEGVLDEVERLAELAGDAGVAANAAILRLFLLESTDPKRLSGEAVPEAIRLIETLESLGDDLGLARAWRLMGDLHWTHSRYAAADEALAKAIVHARRAGADREEADALGRYTGSGTYGPATAEEVERRCQEVLQRMSGTGYEAPALRALAVVRAMQGRSDEARELAGRARAIFEDLGLRLRASFVSETSGAIEMLAGDPRSAERELRAGFEEAIEMGEQGFQSTVAASLAHALIEQGRLDEAEEFAALSARSGADDDVSTQVMWRSARARILAARGEPEEAERLARDALERSEATDDLNMRGETLGHLGEVLSANGDRDGAAEALSRALDLYRAKGNAAAAEATRRRLASLGAS